MLDYTMPNRAKAALLTIDAQRDYFCGESPVKTADHARVLRPLARLVSGARGQGLPIFHMVRFYRPDGSNVDLCRRRMVEEGMRVLMPGSLGAELVPEVAPEDAPRLDPHLLLDGGVQHLGAREEAIYKPRWGAFYATALEARLCDLGVDTLIICGGNFTTSGRATVLEASERDFRPVLVPDAAAALTDDAQRELARVGVHLMSVDECLGWLTGQTRNGEIGTGSDEAAQGHAA